MTLSGLHTFIDESGMIFISATGRCRVSPFAIGLVLAVSLICGTCKSQVSLRCDFTNANNRRQPMHDHWNVSNRISPIRGFKQPVGPSPAITVVRPLGGKAKNGQKLIEQDTCLWNGQRYVYNWAPLKTQIDNVLKRAQLHQLMIDNPPWAFQRGADLSGQKEVETYGNAAPPGDARAWSEYIAAMMRELVATYGLQQVQQWRFCIGREIGTRGHWTGTMLEFFHHYAITHQSIRSIVPQAKIGTHFLWASSKHSAGPQFVKWCSRNNVDYDFIGVSYYPFYDRVDRVDLDRVYKMDFSPIKDIRQWNPDATLEIHEFSLITKMAAKGNSFDNAPDAHTQSFTVMLAKMMYQHDMFDIFRWGDGSNQMAQQVLRAIKGNVYYTNTRRGSPTASGNYVDGIFALDDLNRQCNIVLYNYNANPRSRRSEQVNIETAIPFAKGTDIKWRIAAYGQGSQSNPGSQSNQSDLNWSPWQTLKTEALARSKGSKLGFSVPIEPFSFQKIEFVIPQDAKLMTATVAKTKDAGKSAEKAALNKKTKKRLTSKPTRQPSSTKQAKTDTKTDTKTTRVITNRGTGATVEAELISLRAGKLTCTVKGRRFVFPLSHLSDADQAFIEAWGQRNR